MELTGRIIKGIGGFYYVHDGKTIYECKARGVFRSAGKKPLPGDMVRIDCSETAGASITEIFDRSSELIRPACANAEIALIFFAAADPAPNFLLINKLLIYYGSLGLKTILAFNKTDLADKESIAQIGSIYKNADLSTFFVSVKNGDNIESLKAALKGGLNVISGPSGAGKSSFINLMSPEADMTTGDISKKLGRGRHTTRHSQLFYAGDDTYIMDTPGFTAFELPKMRPESIRSFYPEFAQYEGKCRFLDCAHDGETDCVVKKAVKEGLISRTRYENYLTIYKETVKSNKYK